MSLLDRFPSYDQMIRSAGDAVRRFPLALLCAWVGTIAAVIAIEDQTQDPEGLLLRLMMASALGVSLSVMLTVLSERKNWSADLRLGLQVVGALLLLAYFFSLPEDPSFPYRHGIRFALLMIGLHFATACLPYLGGRNINGFWQYNRALFLRFLTAALYSAAIYVGLAIAYAAAYHLFDIDLGWETEFQLWAIVVGIFNTWFFLAGVPSDHEGLEAETGYPNGLKLFAQFVLLPLVGLYFVILFAYEIKIVALWNLPRGWVSHLVLWYSVVGILSLLLLHPLRDRAWSSWFRVFIKWFFRALTPLVVMLFFAIITRISDYGLTENRYFVLAMAIGLAAVTLYFIFSRVKDIRVIPAVLATLAFLSAFGPWGAFALSLNDQLDRFETLLIENEILVNGAPVSAPSFANIDDEREMQSILRYINETHGLEPFARWLSPENMAWLREKGQWERYGELTVIFGTGTTLAWQKRQPNRPPDSAGATVAEPLPEDSSYYFRVPSSGPIDISDYDILVTILAVNESEPFTLAGRMGSVRFSGDRSDCVIELAGEQSITLPLLERITELAKIYGEDSEVSRDQLTFKGESETVKAKLMLDHVTADVTEDGIEILIHGGKLLLGYREPTSP